MERIFAGIANREVAFRLVKGDRKVFENCRTAKRSKTSYFFLLRLYIVAEQRVVVA